MPVTLQITVDCLEPAELVPFWAEALDYVIEPPPAGMATWNDYWRSVGVPEGELPSDHDAADSIIDPLGVGPRVWFQRVPEPKEHKNRLHLDLKISGGRSVPLDERRRRVLTEADRLIALGASRLCVLDGDTVDHVAVVMQDPAGNEFCIA